MDGALDDVRLLLVDALNIAYGGSGVLRGSAHAIARRILVRTRDAIRRGDATHVLFVFDNSHPTERYEGPPERERVAHARALLGEAGYAVITAPPGVSADAILVALARAAEARAVDSIAIFTADEDLLEAVSSRTCVLSPRRARSGERLLVRRGAPVVRRRRVGRIVVDDRWRLDWQALRAHHQGIDGFTAAQLLERHGSLDGLFGALREIEPVGLRIRLATVAPDVRERRAEIERVGDLPTELDLDAWRLGNHTVTLDDPSFADLAAAATV